MSVTKCPGHMRSLKLNFSATVLTKLERIQRRATKLIPEDY